MDTENRRIIDDDCRDAAEGQSSARLQGDDDCCPACAAANDDDTGEPEGRLVHFGSYALPLKRLVVFGAALSLWAAGLGLIQLCPRTAPFRYLPLIPFAAAYALAGLPVLRSAARHIRRGKALDENFLMSIATIGAFAVGEWEEAVGVMIFYMIGELVQEAAVVRSRRSIKALLALKPDTARIRDGDSWVETAAGKVAVGTLVLVRPGERIPLDGIITEGAGAVDASMLSGESRPVDCKTGDEVRSGTVSVDGLLVIRTTKTAENSSAAKIIALVESARDAKARPERFITSFAKVYTPIVVIVAALIAVIPPLVIPGAAFADWIYRALILLVISCPCALVVSIPLGYFAGIGGLSRRGIMVKGAVHLDALYKAKYVAFDKTGTLTQGKFAIAAIEPAPGVAETTLLATAVLAEQESNHPIAAAIRAGGLAKGYAPSITVNAGAAGEGQAAGSAAGGLAGQAVYREIAGRGIEITLSGGEFGGQSLNEGQGPNEGQSSNDERWHEGQSSSPSVILAGNRQLLESRDITITAPQTAPANAAASDVYTSVYIARDGQYYGRILIGDTDKEGAGEAIRQLRALGIEETVMFSGDARLPAGAAAKRLGISTVEAELLPEDKLTQMEKLTRRGTTIFVGDGINDAPVLARADVGIAMGSGADAAVEAADVIIMTGDPRRVPEAIDRARRTRRIVLGNAAFALGAKAVFITLAILGMANMWLALIADVGVALAAIVNSTRALR